MDPEIFLASVHLHQATVWSHSRVRLYPGLRASTQILEVVSRPTGGFEICAVRTGLGPFAVIRAITSLVGRGDAHPVAIGARMLASTGDVATAATDSALSRACLAPRIPCRCIDATPAPCGSAVARRRRRGTCAWP